MCVPVVYPAQQRRDLGVFFTVRRGSPGWTGLTESAGDNEGPGADIGRFTRPAAAPAAPAPAPVPAAVALSHTKLFRQGLILHTKAFHENNV